MSATDARKNETVPPLQDNVELTLRAAMQRIPALQGVAFWRWLDTMPFLLAFLATALSPLWDQVIPARPDVPPPLPFAL